MGPGSSADPASGRKNGLHATNSGAAPMIQRETNENRRSLRVLAGIPVSLRIGQTPPEHAVTAVVNRQGALLLSPLEYEEGTTLSMRNELTAEAATCRVTWIGSTESDTVHKLGVEFVDAAPTFWGKAYEDAVKAATLGKGATSTPSKSNPSS